MMGASDVLESWAGWLMVSASKATSCKVRASSKIRSISLWTSAGVSGGGGDQKAPPQEASGRGRESFWRLPSVVSHPTHLARPGVWEEAGSSPRLERVLERSMMMCLLGLLRTERLAREMSAVTRVMEILKDQTGTEVRAPGLPPLSLTESPSAVPSDILFISKGKEGATARC